MQRFTSNEQFSKARIEEIDTSKAPRFVEAATLQSTIFLNRGDHFQPIPLPAAAQLAPAFAIAAADFNGDGFEDLFLAQNSGHVPTGEMPVTGGRGLMLQGRGDGGFTPAASGISIAGDQRGAAVADFDHDGRTDLAVGVHSVGWRVLRNTTAPPGLRVTLRGPAGNPGAIGAKFRLFSSGGKATPARELHGGSGSGSQDGLTQVVHPPFAPDRLAVQWPGGSWKTNSVAPGAKEITVAHPD